MHNVLNVVKQCILSRPVLTHRVTPVIFTSAAVARTAAASKPTENEPKAQPVSQKLTGDTKHRGPAQLYQLERGPAWLNQPWRSLAHLQNLMWPPINACGR